MAKNKLPKQNADLDIFSDILQGEDVSELVQNLTQDLHGTVSSNDMESDTELSQNLSNTGSEVDTYTDTELSQNLSNTGSEVDTESSEADTESAQVMTQQTLEQKLDQLETPLKVIEPTPEEKSMLELAGEATMQSVTKTESDSFSEADTKSFSEAESESNAIIEQVTDKAVMGVTPKKPLSFEEYQIVDMYIEGKTEAQIAMDLALTTKYIKTVLSRPYIRNYVNEIVEVTQYAMKQNRIRLLNLIVNAKVEETLEQGLSYADLTKKDVVDLIRELDGLQKEKEKKELGTNQNNTYVNILQKIVKDT